MEKIFQKTRELGEALLESEVYQKMKAAEDKALKNAEGARLMGEYLELRGKIQEMLSTENPDPAVLKQRSDEMDSIQEKLNLIDDIVQMTQARNAFSELINQVNQVLQFIVTGQIPGDSGCSGDCSGCGGSCHSP